jgi:hypothetical protein
MTSTARKCSFMLFSCRKGTVTRHRGSTTPIPSPTTTTTGQQERQPEQVVAPHQLVCLPPALEAGIAQQQHQQQQPQATLLDPLPKPAATRACPRLHHPACRPRAAHLALPPSRSTSRQMRSRWVASSSIFLRPASRAPLRRVGRCRARKGDSPPCITPPSQSQPFGQSSARCS